MEKINKMTPQQKDDFHKTINTVLLSLITILVGIVLKVMFGLSSRVEKVDSKLNNIDKVQAVHENRIESIEEDVKINTDQIRTLKNQ